MKKGLAVASTLFIACIFTSLPVVLIADEKHPIYNKDSTVWHCWTDKDQSLNPPHIVLEQTPEENSTAIAGVGCKYVDVADPKWELCDKEYDKKYEYWENKLKIDPEPDYFKKCSPEALGPAGTVSPDDMSRCRTMWRNEWNNWNKRQKPEPEYTCGRQREILQCRFTDTNANFKRDDDLGIDRIWTFGDGRTAVMKPDDTVLYYNNSSLPKEIFWHCEVSLSNWRKIK